MPPKKTRNDNNKYVLIWWIVSGEKTVTELKKVPVAKRKKDEIIKLMWEGNDGKKKFHCAKIIEFGGKFPLVKLLNSN